jgi:hypothetical protein
MTDSKMRHEIADEDYHYNGYGDADLTKTVPRCSCGVWLFTSTEVLEHKVEVLWEERRANLTKY